MSSEVPVTSQLAAHLAELRSRHIDLAQLEYEGDRHTASDGVGFVRKAILDKVHSVCVKTLPPMGGHHNRAILPEFVRKLALWGLLSHPNVARLTGFHVSDDGLVVLVVSPWAVEGNVREYMAVKSLDLESRISLALDTAAGLKYLHEWGICHGNLNLENVIVFQDGRAVLCDFGSANSTRSKSPASPPITAEFLPDSSSDVWAWGCLLFQILTGVLPRMNYGKPEPTSNFILVGATPTDVYEFCIACDLRVLLMRCWSMEKQARPTIEECFTRLIIAETTPPLISHLEAQPLSNYCHIRQLYTLQRIRRLRGRFTLAEQALGEARERLDQIRNTTGVLWCDYTSGSIQRSQCHYALARTIQERALEAFQSIGAPWGAASATYELGMIEIAQGKHVSAQTRLKRALDAFQRLGDPSGAASCQRDLGYIKYLHTDDHGARMKYQEALGTFKKLEHLYGAAWCQRWLGNIDLRGGMTEEAVGRYEEALEAFTTLKTSSGVALCQRDLGDIEYLQARNSGAVLRYQKALDIYEQLDDLYGVASCQGRLGDIAALQGNPSEARNWYKEAISVLQRLGDLSAVPRWQRLLLDPSGVTLSERYPPINLLVTTTSTCAKLAFLDQHPVPPNNNSVEYPVEDTSSISICDPASVATYHTALTSQTTRTFTAVQDLSPLSSKPLIPVASLNGILVHPPLFPPHQTKSKDAFPGGMPSNVTVPQMSHLSHLRLERSSLIFVKDPKCALGNGGQGTVYQGTLESSFISGGKRRSNSLDVAVKVLKCGQIAGAAAKALMKELSSWSGLRHRHLLPLVGFCFDGDGSEALIISAYQWRGSICQYIKEISMSVIERLRAILQTLGALTYLHQQKICHSDIKGENFLVGHDGNVLLCDFGLARTIEQVEGHPTTGKVLGTTRWSSPELLTEGVRNFPADVWSWGCLFMEIIKTPYMVPYYGIPDRSVMAKIVVPKSRRWPYIPSDLDIPMDVRSVVEPCWQWEPVERATIFQCGENTIRLFDIPARSAGNFKEWTWRRARQILMETREEYSQYGESATCCVLACEEVMERIDSEANPPDK